MRRRPCRATPVNEVDTGRIRLVQPASSLTNFGDPDSRTGLGHVVAADSVGASGPGTPAAPAAGGPEEQERQGDGGRLGDRVRAPPLQVLLRVREDIGG